MGPDGDIITLDELKEKPVKEQEKYIELPNDVLSSLQGMNRADRRRWYKQNRKALKKGVVTNEQS